MNDNKLMNRAADNIRILAASMVEKANSGHPGGAIDFNDFPAPSFVFLAGIFDGHILCLGRKLNVVGIIEHDEIIQP